MARKEEKIILHRTDENGNKVYQFPYVKGDNIETPVPISAGGLGSKTIEEALKALGLNNTVQSLSISDKTITVTLKDGTTKTLTTKDTVRDINYSAGVTYSATTTEKSFTAPSDGVVNVNLDGHNTDWAYCYINDNQVSKITSASSSHVCTLDIQLPVLKGDVIKYKNGSTYGQACARRNVIFYPYK